MNTLCKSSGQLFGNLQNLVLFIEGLKYLTLVIVAFFPTLSSKTRFSHFPSLLQTFPFPMLMQSLSLLQWRHFPSGTFQISFPIQSTSTTLQSGRLSEQFLKL